MIHLFLMVLGLLLIVATLPGTIELVLVTLGGVLGPRRAGSAGRCGALAVVVPAHDEELNIARCVASLRSCLADGEPFTVVVVADNCSDATAERAEAAGARVLVRVDEHQRGKGYALNFAFEKLLAEGFGAVAVVDADTEVEPNFVLEVRRLLGSGADGVQARYGVLNAGASLRTRLMNVALMAFNVLRPRGRDHWSLSVGILGNGFALSRETLLAVPYDAHSVVEDLEYHLRLVRSGRAVRFADATTVRADMPVGGKGVGTQRARWEGGRLRMILDAAPGLAQEVVRGNLGLLEPLLELLLLPLAFHVLALGVALVLPLAFVRLYAAMALAAVGLHVVSAIFVGGGGVRDVAALAAAPFYVAWKVGLSPLIARASRREADWVRTERTGSGGQQP